MQDYWQHTMSAALDWRHDLHAHPELGWQEQRTAARIREALSKLDIPWRSCAGTGTVAILNSQATSSGSSKKSPHIALRGDIDALPITEQTDRAWKSTHRGCMHACGHDGHAATLMATARWLKHVEDRLPGPVTLLFQPAEEGGHGAREMIHDGALEGVDVIYGWHNWPAIPFGEILCPEGIVMCGNGTFEITLTGVGGHASQPELCRDPVLAASAITLSLQQIISRRLSPQMANVVSVTSIEAPSGPTVIPERAVIGGSIRVSSEAAREQINTLLQEISSQTAASYGVQCEVNIVRRYQATINHAAPAQQVRKAWQALHGPEALSTQQALPVMASEDFSYYLKEIPGAYALVGADDGPANQHPCHSPYYDFNDRLIEPVTRLYASLVGAPLP
ncbi:MAG: amidohydrolase [Oleiphilus sp.]|nr:MAG: amidohydrolase [Oleiphilus sp.]